ncbi:MAG: hypothetical protein M1517_04105, partial [Deltaproteobacteria bacterium]|nr:hypothetical protein [Deltaproteobacteria bacterium]
RPVSILQAPYPAVDQLLDQDGAADDAAGEIDVIIDVVKRIRNIRAECNVPAASEVDIGFSGTGERLGLIQKYPHYITRLTRGKSMDVHRGDPDIKGSAVEHVEGLNIYVRLSGVIEPSAEIQRLDREMAKLQPDLEKYKYKLSNEEFVRKAPPEVIEEARQKNTELKERREQLHAAKRRLEEILK